MDKLQLKLAKWLFKRMGYKFVAIKQTPVFNVATYVEGPRHNAYTEIPTLFIEGDLELLKYVDTTGYIGNKEPLRHDYKVVEDSIKIHKLPAEVVAEIILTTTPFPEELQKENEKLN